MEETLIRPRGMAPDFIIQSYRGSSEASGGDSVVDEQLVVRGQLKSDEVPAKLGERWS